MAWMPGEDLLKRLWETIEKTGAGLASPWQIRRVGKAHADVRRHELLVEAQTKLAIDAWRRGEASLKAGEGGLLLVDQASSPRLIAASTTAEGGPQEIGAAAPEHDVPGFVDHSLTRAAVINAEHTMNLRAAIREAEAIVAAAAEQQPGSDRPPPSDDWVNAWREGVERVSDEELRKLWARLLVDEVVAPGAYSLRTLAFVRTLSHEDAKLIRALSHVAADAGIRVYKTPEYLNSIGLDFTRLLHLEEIGLINGVVGLGGLQVEFDCPANARITVSFRSGFSQFITGTAHKFSVPCYGLTSMGRDLIKIEPPVPLGQPFFTELARVFEASGLQHARPTR